MVAINAKPSTKGKTKPKAPAKPKTNVDIAAQYGVQMALINSDPELKKLFANAVAGGWTAAKFTALFQNTNWYKKHSVSWRAAETARTADPGQWNAAVKDAENLILATAAKMGFSLNSDDVTKLAQDTLHTSWGAAIDEATLRKHVVEVGKITGTGGEALTTMDDLKKEAFNQGQSYNDDWYSSAATNILTGDGDIAAYKKTIKEDAKSRYGALAAQLDAGMTVRQAAGGYIATMAQTLGLQDTDVDLNDPLMSRALKGVDASGKATAMPLYEFEKAVKLDDRYFKTTQAKQDMEGLASEIARQFGKAV